MANKLTKKEMFNLIMAQVSSNAEMVAFLTHEIELLDKKATSKKLTATQEQNISLKAEICRAFADGKPRTVTEMIKSCDSLAGLTNQKVSALLKILADEGKVVKSTEKKVSYFSVR